MQIAQGVFGLLVLVSIAYLFSEERRRIPWKTVGYAILLQLLLAVVLLKFAPSRHLFLVLNTLISSLEKALQEGTSMVFGYLGGAPLPFSKNGADSYILAFRGLPMVLLASALSALLFYWRILPRIVRGFFLAVASGIGRRRRRRPGKRSKHIYRDG